MITSMSRASAPFPNYKGPSWLWYLLGAGLALSSATQLRAGQIGPGELLLSLWVGCVFVRHVYSNSISSSVFSSVASVFYLTCMALFFLGSVAAMNSGRYIGFYFMRDATALFFTFTIAWIIAMQKDLGEYCVKGAKSLVCCSVIPLFLLWVYSFHSHHVGPVDLYYGAARYTGWAKDPNSISIIIAPVPFFAVLFIRSTELKAAKFFWAIIGALGVVIGFACLSDGVVLSWTGALFVSVSVYLFNVLNPKTRISAWNYALVTIVSIVLVAAYFLTPGVYTKVFIDFPKATFTHQNKGQVRINLWKSSIRAASDSPIIGLGPGAHARRDGNPMEAHNSIVDIGTRAGLLGLFLFLVFFVILARMTLRSRNPLIVACFVSTVLSSLVYFVMRHPEWWFNMFTIAHLGPGAIWQSKAWRANAELVESTSTTLSTA